MIVKFNSLDRAEKPVFTLCNPGSVYTDGKLSNVVGVLTNCEAEECVFNFNQTSELSFRINSVPIDDDDTADEYLTYMYNAVKNKRLIFMDNIGYFVIDSVNDQHNDGMDYKDVTAKSVDYEIQQKNIPYVADGTYRFSTDGDDVGIFDTIVSSLPLWTIDHIDSSVAEKYRTFEDVDPTLNCLGFMLENLQDAYECIILFDIINRTISVYDQSSYVELTSVHLTKEDVINSLKITEQSDDLYTAISVSGEDDVLIADVNPLGTNTIYNYTYYLDWMTPSLKTKVSAWQTAINSNKANYYTLNKDYYDLKEEDYNLTAEIERLNGQITIYERCLEGVKSDDSKNVVALANEELQARGEQQIDITQQIDEIIDELEDLIDDCNEDKSDCEADLASVRSQETSKLASINTIRNSLAPATYFTSAELEELSNYTFEGTYTDEYIVITDIMDYSDKFVQMKILYDRAEAQLAKISTPTQEFDVSTENILFEKDFEHASEQLKTGCLINVELKEDDVAELFLSCIKVNYDDHSLSMTFGNRFNKFDPKTLYKSVLGSVSKSANTLNFVKDTIYPIKKGALNLMEQQIQNSRDLTMASALASDSEEVIIDSTGYTGKRKNLSTGEFDPEQIKITNNNIVFTDDSWETSKAAIGKIALGDNLSKYGINAEVLLGNIIMGNELHILDSNGVDILTVVDGKIVTNMYDTLETTASSDAIDYIMPIGITIDYYGYGFKETNPANIITDTGKGASGNINKYFLDRKTGKLYKSNGSVWVLNQTLTPKFDNYSTTTQMNTAIEQTAESIKSTAAKAVDKFVIPSGTTINYYGYGQPGIITGSSTGNKYLDQDEGYVYTKQSDGTWLSSTAPLERISQNLNTKIDQTAESITLSAHSTIGYTLAVAFVPILESFTNNGVTFTKQADGSYILDGETPSGSTATAIISTADGSIPTALPQRAISVSDMYVIKGSGYDDVTITVSATDGSYSGSSYGDTDGEVFVKSQFNNYVSITAAAGKTYEGVRVYPAIYKKYAGGTRINVSVLQSLTTSYSIFTKEDDGSYTIVQTNETARDNVCISTADGQIPTATSANAFTENGVYVIQKLPSNIPSSIRVRIGEGMSMVGSASTTQDVSFEITDCENSPNFIVIQNLSTEPASDSINVPIVIYKQTDISKSISAQLSIMSDEISLKVGEDELCSEISTRPEEITISTSRLRVTDPNDNTNIIFGSGVIKTADYEAATSSTPTIGGMLNLNYDSTNPNDLIFDSKNFKIASNGNVIATGAIIKGGKFQVSSASQDTTDYILLEDEFDDTYNHLQSYRINVTPEYIQHQYTDFSGATRTSPIRVRDIITFGRNGNIEIQNSVNTIEPTNEGRITEIGSGTVITAASSTSNDKTTMIAGTIYNMNVCTQTLSSNRTSGSSAGMILVDSPLTFSNGSGIHMAGAAAMQIYNNELAVGISTLPIRIYATDAYTPTAWVVQSDARKKYDVESLDKKYLEVIKNIEPKRYKLIDGTSDYHTGYIAQEVKEAMDKVGIKEEEMSAFVDVNSDGSDLALRYEEFIPMLHKWLQQVDDRLSAMEKERR